MAINLLAGAFALLVLILMVMTRSGQPRVRRSYSGDPFMFYGDGGGGDSGCGSDGGGCGSDGGGCGDGGGGGGD
jgi:hypothetical protein